MPGAGTTVAVESEGNAATIIPRRGGRTLAFLLAKVRAETTAQTRRSAIEQDEAAKVPNLRPPVPKKVEPIFERIDKVLQGYQPKWHLFLENAYSGGGFALGGGRATYVSAYNYIDARASYSITNYKLTEVEFVAPRIFQRRGELSVLGGWREATQIGFYGTGPDSSTDTRTNYLLQHPYASARLKLFTRRVLMLRGGSEFARWRSQVRAPFPVRGKLKYTAATLAGLEADVTYVHTHESALDWHCRLQPPRRLRWYTSRLQGSE